MRKIIQLQTVRTGVGEVYKEDLYGLDSCGALWLLVEGDWEMISRGLRPVVEDDAPEPGDHSPL